MGAILYWDTGGAPGLQGGNGLWSTSGSSYWNSASNGTGTWTAWVNGDTANFESAGTATIVTSNTPSAGGIIFGDSVVTINGGDLALASATTAINTSVSATIEAKLTNGGIFNQGTGILTLSGNNSYGGKTDINAGTMVINGDQSAAKGILTVAGSTTLAGIGTIGADYSLVAGIHRPGVLGLIGQQTFESTGTTIADLEYTSNAILEWQIDRTQSQTRGLG
jgi:fibronectin-binding autotransporter adhesin